MTRIASITIRNILGIEELELTPKGYTQISGANGKGKTSVLEAIKGALKTGHDATLLRKGAEKGEVVLVLDDGLEISKTVTETTSNTKVKRDGKTVARPAEIISQLIDMLSVNPVDFLLAKKADRAKALLEVLPLEADVEKLQEISRVHVAARPGQHALEVIDVVRKQVYDDRTGTNRAVKEKESTINQLRNAMPDLPAGAEDGDEAGLEAAIEAATTERDTKLGQITTKLTGIEAAATAKIDARRVQLQADIDALKATAQADVDTINAETAEQQKKAAAAREATNKKHTDATAEKKLALQAIRNNRDLVAKRAGTLETIAQMESELGDLQLDAENQTQALAAIDQYKEDLLSSLPIPGLEVKDGDVFRHGVALDRLNTAQQVEIAVELAKLRAGELAIACVDRIESLDQPTRDALYKGAVDAGLQLFVTRVTDDDKLKVATRN